MIVGSQTTDDEGGEIVGRAMIEAVENQIRDSNPPETRQTYDRLISEGHSVDEAKRLIACVLSGEMFDMMKHQRPYDQAEYVQKLNRLPELPWDEEE
jgi:hypothetical protein